MNSVDKGSRGCEQCGRGGQDVRRVGGLALYDMSEEKVLLGTRCEQCGHAVGGGGVWS